MKYITLISSFFAFAVLSACSDQEIVLEDEALERAVAEETGTESVEEISDEQREGLNELASEEPVVTLEGMEAFENLERIILPSAELEDVQALEELDSLSYLETGPLMAHPDLEESLHLPLQTLENDGTEIVTGPAALPEIDHEGPSRGVLYEVNYENNTLFLFGSIHVGLEEFYPLRSEAEAAFEDAEQLALEVDISDPGTLEEIETMTMQAFGGSDENLSEHMDEELYEQLQSILEGLGVPEMMMENADPWVLSMLMTNYVLLSTDFEEEYGIEAHFLNLAEDQNLPVLELESAEEQLNALQETPYEVQLSGLEETVEYLDEQEEQLLRLSRIWQAGDTELLEFFRSLDAESDALALDERDEQMAERIAGMLQSDEYATTFAVVGALHTVGDNGIPALLEQEEGFEVTLIE